MDNRKFVHVANYIRSDRGSEFDLITQISSGIKANPLSLSERLWSRYPLLVWIYKGEIQRRLVSKSPSVVKKVRSDRGSEFDLITQIFFAIKASPLSLSERL